MCSVFRLGIAIKTNLQTATLLLGMPYKEPVQ